MRILREFELSAYIKLWWFDSIELERVVDAASMERWLM